MGVLPTLQTLAGHGQMGSFTYSLLSLIEEPIWLWWLWLGFSEPNLEPQWIRISSEGVR